MRKEESTKRKKYLEEDGAPERLFLNSRKYNVFYFRPIADVLTSELWEYLDKLGTFFWGETIDELRELYPDQSVAQRDGCWCCTVASEKSFNLKSTTRAQNEVRRFLRVINEDCSKRCLVKTPAQKRRFSEGIAAGRFTLEARREILAFIQEQEKQSGETLVGASDLETIRRCWKYVERTGDGLKDINAMLK